MTGNGARFKAAGYKRLKPFIKVHGKTIISWVSKMFYPDYSNITFVCRKDHYENLSYFKPELKKAAPNANIFLIDKNFSNISSLYFFAKLFKLFIVIIKYV